MAPFFMPRAAWGLLVAEHKESKLRIVAGNIQLRNLEQLAQITVGSRTYMGRLESVVSCGPTLDVTVGGIELTVLADHPIDIRRTAIADALVTANDIAEDSLEAGERAA